MKFRQGIIALVLALAGMMAMGVPAFAADKGGPNFLDQLPAPTKDNPWTGCWAGANLGYGAQTSEFTKFGETKSLKEAAVDASYGVGAGCDYQIQGIVFGIMADMDWTRADSNVAAWDSQWAALFRVGGLVTPKTLVYGLVGYTKLDGNFVFDAGFTDTFKTDMRGLTLGGGIEQMLRDGWALKAEYRWVDLGNATAPDGGIDGLKDGSKVENNLHQGRLSLVYRFGSK